MNMIKNGMDYVKMDYLRLHWHHVANECDNKHENIKDRCLQKNDAKYRYSHMERRKRCEKVKNSGALESAIYYILLHFKV